MFRFVVILCFFLSSFVSPLAFIYFRLCDIQLTTFVCCMFNSEYVLLNILETNRRKKEISCVIRRRADCACLSYRGCRSGRRLRRRLVLFDVDISAERRWRTSGVRLRKLSRIILTPRRDLGLNPGQSRVHGSWTDSGPSPAERRSVPPPPCAQLQSWLKPF